MHSVLRILRYSCACFCSASFLFVLVYSVVFRSVPSRFDAVCSIPINSLPVHFDPLNSITFHLIPLHPTFFPYTCFSTPSTFRFFLWEEPSVRHAVHCFRDKLDGAEGDTQKSCLTVYATGCPFLHVSVWVPVPFFPTACTYVIFSRCPPAILIFLLVYLFVFVSVSLGASTFVSLSSSLPGIAVSLRAHVYLSGPLCTSLYSCALTFHKLLITSCATFAGRRTDAPQKLIPDPARNFRTRTSGPMTDK